MWTEPIGVSVSMVGGRTGLFCWFAGGGCQAGEMSGRQHSHDHRLCSAGSTVSSLGPFSQESRQESFGHGVSLSSLAIPFTPEAEEKGVLRAR